MYQNKMRFDGQTYELFELKTFDDKDDDILGAFVMSPNSNQITSMATYVYGKQLDELCDQILFEKHHFIALDPIPATQINSLEGELAFNGEKYQISRLFRYVDHVPAKLIGIFKCMSSTQDEPGVADKYLFVAAMQEDDATLSLAMPQCVEAFEQKAYAILTAIRKQSHNADIN